MIINTNVSSITAQEASTNTNNAISSSLEKLSTGLKINKAADDASGLAIADKLRTQATSINQGVDNGNSAVSLLQIADQSMAEQSNILDTVKAKLIQANTDTTSEDGRESIRKDIAKLLEQLDNIAEQTNYNGNVLLQASSTSTAASADLSFQIGETNNDLITNTAIQSNTIGLAATEATIANGDAASVASGEDQIYTVDAATSEVSITSTDDLDVSFSGQLGTVSSGAGANLLISNISSQDVEAIASIAAADADLTANDDGTYTMASGATIAFGDFNLDSITISTVDANNDAATGGGVVITSGDIGDSFSVQNNGDATILAEAVTGTFTEGLTLDSLKDLGANKLTSELADIYQGVIDTAITSLNEYRGDIGSTQNQVESAVRNLMTQSTNVQAAESVIRDVDYAEESAEFNKQNIISQAGSYALSQANSVQQNVLKLLQ